MLKDAKIVKNIDGTYSGVYDYIVSDVKRRI